MSVNELSQSFILSLNFKNSFSLPVTAKFSILIFLKSLSAKLALNSFDVFVDARPNSKNFGQYGFVKLNNPGDSIYVPRGYLHGFCTLEENTTILQKKKSVVIKNIFFQNSTEVVFRSFTEVVKIVGNKYYPTRGKKIDMIIQLINDKSSFKVTLGGCVIKKVNETVIVSKE